MDHIELKSDTMTMLTPQMRQAMLQAEYGDWSYNEDKTVIELESYAAKLFGKEDAAYVPSGTFGNQCSIFTAGKAGEQIIIRDNSHIIAHENGTIGRLSRMITRTLECPKGYITPEDLKKYLKKKKDNQSPITSILVLEQPTLQGLVVPLQILYQTAKMAREQGIHVHMDGARFFNAAAELEIEPSEMIKYCDSMNLCLSKGLLAPVGSIVVGSNIFMKKFKINRKMMGGVMRKPGVVAKCGLIALDKMRHEIYKDNKIAKKFAQELSEISFVQMISKVETNMIIFKLKDPKIFEEFNKVLTQSNITFLKMGENIRFVIHYYIREKQVQIVLGVLKKLQQSLK